MTESQTDLEKMRAFVESFPDANILSDLTIDYTSGIPNSGGLFPSGLVEISRQRSITGKATVTNQYNFALYTVFEKSPDEDEGATYNAEWLIAFQNWVQQQSVSGNAPTFGDEPHTEQITAQNGTIYSAEEEGTALYVIQISAVFKLNY